METGWGGHRQQEMTDAGKKCRLEKKRGFQFFFSVGPPLCQWELPRAEKGSMSSTLGHPLICTPFPSEGRISQMGALEVSHGTPTQHPLTWFKGVSVCLWQLALFISYCPHPLPKFGVLPEGPSLPPLSSASSSSLDPLALEVIEGQPGLQICP